MRANATAPQPSHAAFSRWPPHTGSNRGNCQRSACKTLGYALTQASRNDTIVTFPGTYHESGNANVVGPRLTGLTIRSTGSAHRTVIDAAGNANGILIEASGVSVTGLTVENAELEGILAEPPRSSWPTPAHPAPAGISHITIASNIVTGNDKAYNTKHPGPTACPASPTDTDDCGEGTAPVVVTGNEIFDNVNGVAFNSHVTVVGCNRFAHVTRHYFRYTPPAP